MPENRRPYRVSPDTDIDESLPRSYAEWTKALEAAEHLSQQNNRPYFILEVKVVGEVSIAPKAK